MYETEPTHSLAMLTVQFDHMVIDYPVKVAAAAAAIAQSENLLRVARKALEAVNVKKIAQVSLRCKGYFYVKMSHPEIVEAMFGSYLLPRQDLANVSASLDDVVVRLDGTEGASKFELTIAPQTAEQVKGDFFSWPNIDFLNEPRSRNNPPMDFLSRIDRDCLNVECLLYRKDVAPEDVIHFMRRAPSQADGIAERSVNHLLSLPTRE